MLVRETEKIAAKLVEVLKQKGFVIQRYDAYSTNSIYLKLDYGLAHSIRISDHIGKPQYSYRYNVIIGSAGVRRMNNGQFDRYWYSEKDSDLSVLVNDIVKERDEKVEIYGRDMYERMMRDRLRANEGAKGFWSQARLV